MQSFEYANPATVQEALGLLSAKWGEADVLAGGTDLLSLMKEHLHTPKRVVNIKNIKELEGIQKTADGIRIGALVTMDELAKNADVKAAAKSLSDAAAAIPSPQIRHMGTVGGDLCQRPRCWYYRQGFGLLGQQDGKSLIPQGDNRYHAIFGNEGPAYFVNPSAIAPPLIALGATLEIVGPNGKTRQVPVADFFRIPGSADERENALAANEVITRISIPVRGLANATYEVRQRQGLDWPLVAASVAFRQDKAEIVLGHVAPIPWRVPDAAAYIVGKYPSIELAAGRAAEAAAKGAKPLSKNAYKVQLVKTAVKRAILAAAGKKEG